MVKVLSLIAKGADNREEIANKLDLSKTWISDNLTKLEKLRFVTKERKGKSVYLSLAETSFAQEFKNLVESRPSIKFEDFLYGLNFRILSYCLFSFKTVESIAKQLKLSKKTIYNRLPNISRGLITWDKKVYLTNKKTWPILYSFLEKFRMFSLKPGNVLWKFEDEIIFTVIQEKDVDGVLTGFSKYSELGVGIWGLNFCCYLPKKKLSKEEIFIHSILEISDARQIMLTLTFYLKHRLNEKKLEELAMEYDCLERFKDLKRILKQEKTKVLSFIKEKELKEFFRKYDVKWKGN